MGQRRKGQRGREEKRQKRETKPGSFTMESGAEGLTKLARWHRLEQDSGCVQGSCLPPPLLRPVNNECALEGQVSRSGCWRLTIERKLKLPAIALTLLSSFWGPSLGWRGSLIP